MRARRRARPWWSATRTSRRCTWSAPRPRLGAAGWRVSTAVLPAGEHTKSPAVLRHAVRPSLRSRRRAQRRGRRLGRRRHRRPRRLRRGHLLAGHAPDPGADHHPRHGRRRRGRQGRRRPARGQGLPGDLLPAEPRRRGRRHPRDPACAEVRSGWAEIVKHALLDGGETLDPDRGRGRPRGAASSPDCSRPTCASRPRSWAAIRARPRARAPCSIWGTRSATPSRSPAASSATRTARPSVWACAPRSGCLSACRVSTPRRPRAGRGCCSAAGLPERLQGAAVDDVARLVTRDKKVAAGEARFVLLADIGRPVTGVIVPSDLRAQVIAWLLDR